jgi:hypothetical protein
MGPSFMRDRRPPPAEEHDHIGPWFDSSGMIDVRDHEKDTSIRAIGPSNGVRDQGNADEEYTCAALPGIHQGAWLQPNTHWALFVGLEARVHAA